MITRQVKALLSGCEGFIFLSFFSRINRFWSVTKKNISKAWDALKAEDTHIAFHLRMENSVCTLFFNASYFLRQRKVGILSSSEVSSSSASSGKDTSCFFLPSFRGWSWPQSIPRISKFSIFYALSKIWRSTMEFNNGNERRKLNKKWERLRVQYQQAGMSEDAIQAMYDFDLGVLNSERSYVANTLAIVDDGDDSTGRKSSDFMLTCTTVPTLKRRRWLSTSWSAG